jgi:large subunit ribosomal protein L21
MYGVVELSGHQYKVAPGDIIDVQKLDIEAGADYETDQVLFVSGDSPQIGKPTVSGAKVKAKVIKQARDRKVIVFKRKRGLYQKKRGHRTHYTALLITEIDNGAGQVEKIDASSTAAKKHLK